jgi:hypothetical protein
LEIFIHLNPLLLVYFDWLLYIWKLLTRKNYAEQSPILHRKYLEMESPENIGRGNDCDFEVAKGG